MKRYQPLVRSLLISAGLTLPLHAAEPQRPSADGRAAPAAAEQAAQRAAPRTSQGSGAPEAREAVPDATASQISDWALAGIIWSDASLTKRLAQASAREAQSAADVERMQNLAAEAQRVIDSLEQFGWRQVRATPSNRTRNPAVANDPAATRDPAAARHPAPADPSMRQTADDAPRRRALRDDDAAPSVQRSISQFDTETPRGSADPGIDDEVQRAETNLDIDQYRVDDFVDESDREIASAADAVEDGVEGAIAAAASRRGVQGRQIARVSPREMQTLSSTLPFGNDSIYDSDDYDPDVDYVAENPLGMFEDNPESVGTGDLNDEVQPTDTGMDIEGEDEFLAESDVVAPGAVDPDPPAGEPVAPEPIDPDAGPEPQRPDDAETEAELDRVANPPSVYGNGSSEQQQQQSGSATAQQQQQAGSTAEPRRQAFSMSRYTADAQKHQADARWVQFHLQANQQRWDAITSQPPETVADLINLAEDAQQRLRANAMVAGRASANQQLRQILAEIVR